MLTFSAVQINVPGVVPGGSLLPPLGAPWDPSRLGSSLIAHWDASDESAFTYEGGVLKGWAPRSGNLIWEPVPGYARPVRTANGWNTNDAGVFFSGDPTTPQTGAMLNLTNGPQLDEVSIFVMAIRHQQSDDAGSSSRTVAMLPLGSLGQIATIGFTRPTSDPEQNKLFASGVGTGAGPGQPALPWATGQKAIAMGQFSLSGLTTRVNGGASSSTANLGASTVPRWMLGNHTGNRKACAMTVKQVIAISGPLSTSNRQKLEGYLAWTGGIQASLPANHPYRDDGPNV